MSESIVLAAPVRTPIGRFGGAFKDLPVEELGATVIGAALDRAGLEPRAVDEVIMGCVLQAGAGVNPARLAALRANVPIEVPAYAVNKACASGIKAVALACRAVGSGDARIVVAGGMENMSRVPYLALGVRWGQRSAHSGHTSVRHAPAKGYLRRTGSLCGRRTGRGNGGEAIDAATQV